MRDFTLYYINSPLLKVDSYVPKEYDPLVNPRVHLQGHFKHNIANTDFLDTYMHFLKYYVDKSPTHVSAADRLLFVVYLVAQDRQAEALRLMDAAEAGPAGQRVQWDYLRVYALVTSAADAAGLEQAGIVAARYADYPVLAWQRRFAAVGRLLAELRGDSLTPGPRIEAGVFEANAARAAEQPSLQLAALDGKLVLTTRHLDEVALQFFVVDIETKFSLNPFDLAQASSAGLVKASAEARMLITGPVEADGSQRQEVSVPAELQTHNLLVQAAARGLTASADRLPSRVAVSLVGDEVEVTADGHRLSGCYVKVFARSGSGNPAILFKDGYTNLLGRFNYASVCLESIDRFTEASILAFDLKHGASILRVTKSDRQKSKLQAVSHTSEELNSEISQAVKSKNNKYAIA